MKRKTIVALAAGLAFLGFFGVKPVKAETRISPATTAENPLEVEWKVVENFEEADDLEAAFTQKVYLEGQSESLQYFKFSLEEESWVYFAPNYSLNNNDFINTKFQIFSDKKYSNVKTDKFGLFNGDVASVVLPAGEYYGSAHYSSTYSTAFHGNINIKALAIPVSKTIVVEQKLSKNKNKVDLSLSSKLGAKTLKVQARPGKIGRDSIGNNKYWIDSDSTLDSTDGKVTVLEMNDDNDYAYTVKKNGYYSFLVYDSVDNGATKLNPAVLQVIKVSGIDDVKPTVTGVKNGRTYKKSATFKFTDKGSGVKSALLNGKKVKSATKVTKAGNYTLEVKDKAGNVRKVSFTVR